MSVYLGSETDKNAPFNQKDYGEMSCPSCKGRGKIDDEDCYECDGSGDVPMTELDYLDKLESKREDERD